ncbi:MULTISPECIES: hypothetical protein [Rhizobium]|uniref:hypothetical protein n=1 Tax=Rhizobium TaxID=379 RepID=UPI0014867164|nr:MULTISPECIES: hypothetical protein [Rhizobium]MBX4898684.1 hypothetical protein [Rhizobium bangladeshense]MBX4905569.1 hypothetical protein [Rhizobium bangladeshense]MBX4915836.1 hypothetical protein [Rhizobium bangladeshense]MBY3595569.1 hypothetical protein [Rhizobium bangladeshense]MBY3616637.1 hypothetical protein [Rhizobium bangladeshense]
MIDRRRRIGRKTEAILQQDGTRLLNSARLKQVVMAKTYLYQFLATQAEAVKALAEKL